MVKVRLQGTEHEVRCFLEILRNEDKVVISNTSDFFKNKGTDRYKRLYTEAYIKRSPDITIRKSANEGRYRRNIQSSFGSM